MLVSVLNRRSEAGKGMWIDGFWCGKTSYLNKCNSKLGKASSMNYVSDFTMLRFIHGDPVPCVIDILMYTYVSRDISFLDAYL